MRVMKRLAAVLIIILTLVSFAACAEAPSDRNLIANGNFVSYDAAALVTGDVVNAYWTRGEYPALSNYAYQLKEEELFGRSPVPVYSNNKYKTGKWSQTFPEGWKVRTSDSVVASLAGFEYGAKDEEANAVTFIVDAAAAKSGSKAIGCGWIQIYQKVRVNPRTDYKIAFEYKGFMRPPDSSLGNKATNAVGVCIGFLEDPSYIPSGAVDSRNTNSDVGYGSVRFEKYDGYYTCSQVYNSGSLRHITVCISIGAPGHEIGDSRVDIRNISMTEYISEVTGSGTVHTIYKNRGYRDTTAAAIIIAAASFIFLAALCFIIFYYVNKNYVYSKPKEDEGVKLKAPLKGKPNKKADLAADEGESIEVPLSESPEDTGFEDDVKEEKQKEAKEPGKFGLFIGNKVLPAVKTAWQKQPLLIMLAFAFIIRIICVFVFKGWRPDMNGALGSIAKLMEDGVEYYNLNGVNYAPGQLYIFYYIGLFMRWFNLTDGGAGFTFFYKLPVLLADLGIGWLIYSFTSKFVNKKTALGVSALYLFNPAILFAFTIWGGMSAVWLFFLTLALCYMLDRKYLQMCAAYAGAVLFSVSALAVAPLLAVFLIAVFLKACFAYFRRSDKEKKASDGVLTSPKYSALWKAPLGVLLFFVSLFILCLPLTASGIDGAGFKLFSFCVVFQKLALDLRFNTNNGFNVAAFMGNNGILTPDISETLLTVFYFLICALLAGVYVMKRNRANLLLLSSFLYLFTAYFMANSNPLTAVPALVILLLGCVAVGDRRLYGHYLVLSAVCLLNISAAMISAQYMNNLPDYLLDASTNVNYSGKALLPQWFMIAGTVIAVLGLLYHLIVVMDVTVANRRKVFVPFDAENPHYALDTFKTLFW